MFTTKFRATCAAVSTALMVAIAIGPMTPISQAAPNTGQGPTKLSAEACGELLDVFHDDLDAATKADAAGARDAGDFWLEQAEIDMRTAHAGGCAWARVLPSSGVGSSGSRAAFGG